MPWFGYIFKAVVLGIKLTLSVQLTTITGIYLSLVFNISKYLT